MAMHPMAKTVGPKDPGTQQYLTFELGNETYAVEILRVREILMGLDRDGLLGGLMTWLWVSRIRRYAAVPVVVVVAPPGELVPAFGRFNPTYSG